MNLITRVATFLLLSLIGKFGKVLSPPSQGGPGWVGSLPIGRAGVGLLLLLLPLTSFAQFRINLGGDSPLRKLNLAEMAITNL